MTHPLEPSAQEMRAMGESALGFIVRFIETLPDQPASEMEGALELARTLREPMPEGPSRFEDLLQVVEEGATKGFNTTGPGYVPYVPGGGLFAAALADFLATSVNRFVNVWNASPPFAQIEATVIRWFCDLFGYPAEAQGILTSGGSMSIFSGIVTARHARLGEDFTSGTMYFSQQTHASVAKAAALAGFPRRSFRLVPTTPELRLDLDALRDMIKRDGADGLSPFLVVASAGTTNTGAVDPIAEVAEIAREHGLWLHVDGAYGGPFQLTDRGRHLFRGIEEADSITLDPHKAMFLPYGTGSLLVREGRLLREAHFVGADYLQDLAKEDEIPNFADYSPELSRDFRGLRVWLPLKLHGSQAFRDALDEKLDLARYLHEELRATPGFELPWEPELSVVAFRFRPERGDPDEFNQRLLERVNASKRVFLSSTLIDGRFVIRACIVSFRTHRDRIEEAAEIIQKAAVELVDEG
jgi:aromatic-L-amino-acid/L-tryptophan decarboxylase